MSERLFIRVGVEQQQTCSWLIWSEQESEIIASGELSDAGELVSLAERAGDRPIDLLVPSSVVTLTHIELPEKGQRQAIQALPFMLEEELAQNVDELHFVVGPKLGNKLSVAIVAHQQLELWLNWLKEAGLTAKSIVPDCLALPLSDCQWAGLKLGEDYLLRMGETTGSCLSQEWLTMMLPRFIEREDEEIRFADYNQLTLPGVQSVAQPLELPMLVLAKGALLSPFNLLSGIYAPKRQYSKYLVLWRKVAIIVAVIFALSVVDKTLNIYQLNSRATQVKNQSESIFKRTVPGANRIVNLRAQIERHLRDLQGDGGGSAFFSMISGLEQALKQLPNLKPITLRYDGGRGEIRMQVEADDYSEIEQFQTMLSRQYSIDTGAMNSREEKVTSTITLRVK